jgi:hypothetical protein
VRGFGGLDMAVRRRLGSKEMEKKNKKKRRSWQVKTEQEQNETRKNPPRYRSSIQQPQRIMLQRPGLVYKHHMHQVRRRVEQQRQIRLACAPRKYLPAYRQPFDPFCSFSFLYCVSPPVFFLLLRLVGGSGGRGSK